MDISCQAVERYLHEHIPLSQAMAVSVKSIDSSGVTLSAPIQPNINHRSTAFGGSISAIAILSAWTLVHVRLQVLAIRCQIVIQSSSIDYTKPIDTDFQVHCLMPADRDWDRFIATIVRYGKGRIALNAEVYCRGLLAGNFQGEYVALKQTNSEID
jgi:thioesterase domain-containing protein